MTYIPRVVLGMTVLTTSTACCVLSMGCKATPSAKTTAEAIKQCASSDAIGADAIRYTGPTGAGPGSYWVQLNGTSSMFVIGAVPSDIFGDVPQNIFAPPSGDSACAFSSTTKSDVKLNLGA